MLARKVLEGELEPSKNFQDQMNRCMDCLSCNSICPVGIRPADLALDMRYAAEQVKSTGWKTLLFRHTVQYPGRLEIASLPLRLYQNLGIRWVLHRAGLISRLPAKLRDLENQLPPIPARPLRVRIPRVTRAVDKKEHTVAFFLGCGQSLLHAESSKATIDILAHNGCEIITPRQTRCCGMPARGYGRMDEVLAMARFNINLYETLEVSHIVTDCATCGSMLKEYAHFFKDDHAWADRARRFSEKVRDVSEFLSDIGIKKPPGSFKATVTYHDPCHMIRAQNIRNQPRQLLRLIDGVTFVEMKDAGQCCGSAGTQLVTHYQNSSAILERKIANLADTGAEIVASGCPACRMQLRAGIARAGLNVEVMHPVELLARAYENNPKGDERNG
jgi:glycolate oxidase iron-sulfur subunit